MARGSKAKYTAKQRRQAREIEESYESRGVGKDEAERRAWATVNNMTGGGRPSDSGTNHTNKEPARKGGRLGGRTAAHRPKAARSASAKKAARARARRSA